MAFFLWFSYALFGMTISVPYCLLAGWSWEHWPMVAFVAPAFLFVWMMLGVMAGHVYPRRGRKWPIGFCWRSYREHGRDLPGSKGMFWTWTVYGLLPIIVHWSAMLIGALGHKPTAAAFDAHRYASPLYILAATLLLFCLIGMTIGAWEATKNGWTRLSNLVTRR